MTELDAKEFVKTDVLDKNGQVNKNFSRASKYKFLRDFLSNFPGKTSLENLYLFYTSSQIPLCECGNPIPFDTYSRPYKSFCSLQCARKSSKTWDKYKETCLKKYGVDSTNKVDEISIKRSKSLKKAHEDGSLMEKIKTTNIEKHGLAYPLQREEIKKKIKDTKLEKYGDENYNNQEKTKETCLEKYGVDHAMKLELINKKVVEGRKETTKIRMFNKLSNLNSVLPLFSLSEYVNIHYSNKYLWKCRACGNIFNDDIYANRLPRCPVCFPPLSGPSIAEKEVANWIKTLNIGIEENTRSIIHPLELDIYIPSYDFAIEFDGLYWHSELKNEDKNYHLNKTKKCNKKNINLVHIFEDEWIEKQDIVKSIISSKLNIYQQTIGARKCQLKEINSKEASVFYDINHLQGPSNSKINIGLFYDDELISCLSLSAPRFNKKYDWEIIRFANKLNTKVIGSFAKLFKHFLSNYEGSIITYSDKRYFDGSIYKRNGFTELKDSSPSYYYTDYKHRYNRIEFQKHKLKDKLKDFDPTLTEWENMQLNGWDRIWDCGNKVFEFKTE